MAEPSTSISDCWNLRDWGALDFSDESRGIAMTVPETSFQRLRIKQELGGVVVGEKDDDCGYGREQGRKGLALVALLTYCIQFVAAQLWHVVARWIPYSRAVCLLVAATSQP
jgi:hypothetical protein